MEDYKPPEWLAVLGYGNDYLASLKQKALLFDAFLMTAPARRADHLLSKSISTDLDFLKSKGILVDFEQAMGQTPRIIQKVWGPKPPKPERRPQSSMFSPETLFGAPSDAKLLGVLSVESNIDNIERDDWQGGNRRVRDTSARINATGKVDSVPICTEALTDDIATRLGANITAQGDVVLSVALEALPTPDVDCPWESILDFKNEMSDKQWGFRRFLNGLSTKTMTAPEIRDEIEWTVNEYKKAMEIHRMKSKLSFVEVYLCTPLEMIEDIVKLNLSKIGKGLLAVKKREIEMIEGEKKAPGRECAYLFDAREQFEKH